MSNYQNKVGPYQTYGANTKQNRWYQTKDGKWVDREAEEKAAVTRRNEALLTKAVADLAAVHKTRENEARLRRAEDLLAELAAQVRAQQVEHANAEGAMLAALATYENQCTKGMPQCLRCHGYNLHQGESLITCISCGTKYHCLDDDGEWRPVGASSFKDTHQALRELAAKGRNYRLPTYGSTVNR